MAIAFISPTSLDKEVFIPAVAGKRIRLLRLLAASSIVRWITFSSAASALDTGTVLFGDFYVSNLFTFFVPFDEEFAVVSNADEGIYIQLSSSGGKTELTAWYDVVPA